MKSIYQFIICIGFVLLMNACSYLDVVPDNVATLDNAFSDRYTTEKYLATCYWGMPKSAGWNENPAIFGAMEVVFNKEHRTDGGMKYGLGQDSPTSALINYWGGTGDMIRSLYAGIRECNTFMKGVNGVKDLNQYEKNRMIAEVKLIKAYMHFYLLTFYGPICPLRENTEVNESTQGVRVYREKVDDCFAYILELLDEVIDSNALPAVIENRTTELGRFTRPAAYMMKAKALLYWASPLFNGNTDYNSFMNHEGEPFFNQAYDASRWTAAAEACKKAVSECEAAGIRLYALHPPYGDQSDGHNHTLYLRTGDEAHKYYIQKGEQTAAMNFDREPRFYSTLGFDRGKWYGNSYKNSPDDDAECLYPKNRFGEYSSVFNPGDYNATGYWPKKLVCINSTFRDANSVSYENYPYPDMRFADLLLMCAEALNESKETPDAEVYKYIDMVRERAGLAGVLQSWQKYANQPDKPRTKTGMRDIIQRERKIELACEGVYYWDSHRWKTAVKEQNRLIQGWNVNAKEVVDYYTPVTLYNQTFSYKNYFAPLPEKDMTNNPQLIQNPGW